jgi:hypothetical protein
MDLAIVQFCGEERFHDVSILNFCFGGRWSGMSGVDQEIGAARRSRIEAGVT